jgi:hypothetical protein
MAVQQFQHIAAYNRWATLGCMPPRLHYPIKVTASYRRLLRKPAWDAKSFAADRPALA